jgi:ubiquinone/menaquinone biosynthesis C-methylase UbiE
MDGKPTGEVLSHNVLCENLENLTFACNSFDIVITEDILEHVRNYRKALSEIHRVLKPGGKHIFTIPFSFVQKTIVRIDTSKDKDIYLLPPEYHGDNLRQKIIAYRNFGIDLYEDLQSIGFTTEVRMSTLKDSIFGIYTSFDFISTKA